MQDYRNLKVWEKGHELTLAVYKATETYPNAEIYGLTSQMRRASASIPMNIAEGCGRGGNPELSHFLHIAFGSTCELEYQLLLSKDLNYIKEVQYQEISKHILEVKQMLSSLLHKVKASS